MFYSLIKSYDTLNNTVIPSHEQCIDDMKGEVMPQDEYDHMVKLWKTSHIKTWGEYYELYKRVLEAKKKGDAVMEGSFKRINNQGFDISTKEQTKTPMTCTDNKRWILDGNVHTLAFNHYRLKDMVRRSYYSLWTAGQKMVEKVE